jgi:hypothetical protein
MFRTVVRLSSVAHDGWGLILCLKGRATQNSINLWILELAWDAVIEPTCSSWSRRQPSAQQGRAAVKSHRPDRRPFQSTVQTYLMPGQRPRPLHRGKTRPNTDSHPNGIGLSASVARPGLAARHDFAGFPQGCCIPLGRNKGWAREGQFLLHLVSL